jgi:hypothetical protein
MKSELGEWIEPAPNPLPEILDNTKSFLSRYLVFPKPAHATAVALWTAHTWVFQSFDYTPYLYISSPVKRCGKSRVFDCLRLLCASLGQSSRPPRQSFFVKLRRMARVYFSMRWIPSFRHTVTMTAKKEFAPCLMRGLSAELPFRGAWDHNAHSRNSESFARRHSPASENYQTP